jgi:SAM-dependent methyltransferase
MFSSLRTNISARDSDPLQMLRLPVRTSIAEHDEMATLRPHYFGTGMTAFWALQNIVRARRSVINDEAFPRDILDFGSGCGRVARFLVAGFPNSKVHVTDIRVEDVQWCARNLGCNPIEGTLGNAKFDLIWLGSVFTHLSESAAADLFRMLIASLQPGGVIAFSSQGHYARRQLNGIDWEAAKAEPWRGYELNPELVASLARQWDESGYAYVEYPNVPGYGVCLARPERYADLLRKMADVRQIFFQEQAYDNHQDVSAFMLSPVNGEPAELNWVLGVWLESWHRRLLRRVRKAVSRVSRVARSRVEFIPPG